MEISVQQKGNVAILNISGNIDINASGLIEKVSWCIKSGFKDILCNFQDVDIVDYAGLSVLAIAYKNVQNNEGRMKFASVSVHVKKLFALVYMDTLFEVYDNVDLALIAFKEDRIISEIKKKKLRRRFKRLPLEQVVEYKSKYTEGKWYRGKILNLSAIGALIFCEKIYPLGEIITLRFSLRPQLPQVELDARVIWHVSRELQHEIYPGMGVEFYNIDFKVQEKIIEFVERNLPHDIGREERRTGKREKL